MNLNFFKRGKEKEKAPAEPIKHEPGISVGLDIGTTKVVAFAGRRSANGKIEVLGYGKHQSIGVQRGLVINIAHTANVIQRVIQDLQNAAGIDIDTVMVGIAGQYINNIKVVSDMKRQHADADSEITKEDIKQFIDNMFKTPTDPGTQIIDVIPQEYVVDKYPPQKNPIGMTGTVISSEFNIITCKTQHIKNILQSVNKCNLKTEGLELEPIASAEVVLDEDEKEIGVALIDIGGGTTDIVIFIDGIMRYTAVIPIAGDVITEDIKYLFKGITKEQAESLKCEHGSTLPNVADKTQIISIPGIRGREPIEVSKYDLASAINYRMKEIIARIDTELENSGCKDRLNCGVVFTGGGAQMNGLKEFAEINLGMKVRIGNPEEKILFKEDDVLSDPRFATGLGLMVMSLEQQEEEYDYNGADYPAQTQTNTPADKEAEEKTEAKPSKAPTRRGISREILNNLLGRILEEDNLDDDDDEFDDDDRI